MEYSLVARSVEREHVPVAFDTGMGVIPWSPLAGGFLTGKYQKQGKSNSGRLSGDNPFGDSKFSEKNWEILEAVREVVKDANRSLSQVSLAWLMSRRGVSSTLIGASKLSQLQDNLGALDFVLTAEQLRKLSAASELTPEFSDSLTGPYIREMIYGGHTVKGWRE